MFQDQKELLKHILLTSIIKYISETPNSSFKDTEVISIVTCLSIRQSLGKARKYCEIAGLPTADFQALLQLHLTAFLPS